MEIRSLPLFALLFYFIEVVPMTDLSSILGLKRNKLYLFTTF